MLCAIQNRGIFSIMGFLDIITKTIGVDPGSQNLRIIHNGQIIFNETAQLSIDPETNKVSGFGNKSIYSKPNVIIKPVNTVIADFHGFEQLLRGSLRSSLNERTWFPSNYKMYFSLPISATEVEKRAYRDSGEHAGAKEVYIIYQPCSSSIGMDILYEKKNFILVDFSASKVEITAFANSIPIAEGSIRIGTWKLQKAIRNYIFRNYKINLTGNQLEDLLFNLPNLGNEFKIEHQTIKTNEIKHVLAPYFTIIEDQIHETLEQITNNKHINQIISNGFYFTGGGAYINWLTEKIALNGKLKLTVSSNPLLDNINGLIKLIQSPENYKKYLMT